MRPHLALALCVGTAAVGFVAGLAVDRSPSADAGTTASGEVLPVDRGDRGRARTSLDDDARAQRERQRAAGEIDDATPSGSPLPGAGPQDSQRSEPTGGGAEV